MNRQLGITILILFLITLCVNNALKAQDLLFVKDSIFMSAGCELFVKGGIKSDGNALIQNDGKIYIETNLVAGPENWTNNKGQNLLSGTGKVVFRSNEPQTIGGTDTTIFFDLEINNTSDTGINLNISQIVEDTLFLYDGIVNTDTNFVIINNTDSSAISGYLQGVSTSSYINGNLRRHISAGTFSYGFPVGLNDRYYLQEVLFTGISGINYIDAKFDTLENHNDIDLDVTESLNTYESVCTEGVWFLTPDTQPDGGSYDIRAYIGNFTGCSIADNKFAILKRPDLSLTAADWQCESCGVGTGLSANGGEGRLTTDPYALRKNLTTFSQFGIGKIQCNPVSLRADTAICDNTSLLVVAGDFASYLWSDTSVDTSIMVSTAGDFYVDVTDYFGCTSSDTVVIDVNALPALDLGADQEECDGNSISLDAGEGFIYLWSTTEASQIINVSHTDEYHVTITDENLCTETDTIIITINPIPTVNMDSVISVSCYGYSDGSITSVPGGGTPPYFFAWIGGGTEATEDSLTIGNFTVTISDVNNCIVTADATITQPDTLVAAISSSNDAVVFGACNGNATVGEAGGTTPYSWSWTNNDTLALADSLCAGSYMVTVTDQNGCTDTAIVTISEPTDLLVNTTSQNVSCYGACDADATVTPFGGSAPYAYLWPSSATDSTQSGLCDGTYIVTISDSHLDTTIAVITITQPDTLIFEVETTDVLCFGNSDGSVAVIPNGGTLPYTFQWSNFQTDQQIGGLQDGSYTVTVTDTNGCSQIESATVFSPEDLIVGITAAEIPCFAGLSDFVVSSVTGGTPYNSGSSYSYLWSNSSTAAILANVTAGQYSVTVMDSVGCIAYDTVSITVPSQLVLSGSVTDSDCGFGNGTATVITTGGTPIPSGTPYIYLWDLLTGGQTEAVVTGLDQGTYTVTVTDNNSCTATLSMYIDCEEICSAYISDSAHVDCNGDSTGYATAAMSYGVEPFTYLWSTSDTTAQIDNLSTGNYIVTITDSIGCKSLAAVTICEPPKIITNVVSFDTDCYGNNSGWAIGTATGGTGSLSFLWSTGGVTNDTITGLSPGVYTLIVSDGNFCQSLNITTIGQPSALSGEITILDNISCFGNSDGSSLVNVEGGTTPYTFNWSSGENSQTSENEAAGIYSVTVSDANNCNVIFTIDLSEPEQLEYSHLISETSCIDGSDGMIYLLAGNGTKPYTYQVYSQETGSLVGTDTLTMNLAPAYYNILISDSNNCTITDELYVPASDNECILIPDVITPNGDYNNDTWDIGGIQFYDFVSIEIYNRWGDNVFLFQGSGSDYQNTMNQWDGTFKGKKLPHASYLYIVNLHNNKDAYTGVIIIIR